ncbi:MAG: sulfite exporter TauE/SafE family protein [Campylobacterales bacterium]
MQIIDLTTLITIAFLGSLGHCIGMCGGFVVAYSAAKIDPILSKSEQIVRHLIYNAGRVSAYAMLGVIFGAVGSIFLVTPEFHGALLLTAGILMILTALALVGASKLLLSVEHSLTSLPLFKRLFSLLIKSRSIPSFFGLGILNGFFPCGFVYFFAAKAAATASPLEGALVMTIFGLATVPTLAILGLSVSFLRGLAFRQAMNRLAAGAIFLYGLYTIYGGLAYFFDLPL